jgi:hypothetical protein
VDGIADPVVKPCREDLTLFRVAAADPYDRPTLHRVDISALSERLDHDEKRGPSDHVSCSELC